MKDAWNSLRDDQQLDRQDYECDNDNHNMFIAGCAFLREPIFKKRNPPTTDPHEEQNDQLSTGTSISEGPPTSDTDPDVPALVLITDDDLEYLFLEMQMEREEAVLEALKVLRPLIAVGLTLPQYLRTITDMSLTRTHTHQPINTIQLLRSQGYCPT